MSDSDEDFFFATQLPSKKRERVSDDRPELSQSVVEYFFLITFNWNLMVDCPFELNVREKIKDFPNSWIKGSLSNDKRIKKIRISALGGGEYSLFCKVDKGSIIIFNH